jgi:hypothetical protein
MGEAANSSLCRRNFALLVDCRSHDAVAGANPQAAEIGLLCDDENS